MSLSFGLLVRENTKKIEQESLKMKQTIVENDLINCKKQLIDFCVNQATAKITKSCQLILKLFS